MTKNRQAITCNGRPAFFASMYEDIRKVAIECGWAVALHGSLVSDMDIMAMPWTDDATTFEGLVRNISKLFDGNPMSELYSISYNEKPHGRIVATIPIWSDFYLDISTIKGKEETTIIETVRSNRLDVEIPSDYFEDIKEVHVIDEWTEECKVFTESDGWIPCSERLPEEDVDVLVCIKDGYDNIYQTVTYHHIVWQAEVGGMYGEVIAWMPLPEPYKEGKQ